jgi:tetratricopeptide (TPR) repeat protein
MEGCVATSSDLIDARALADAGRLDEAAALCRTMLTRDVSDLAALHLLGVILLRTENAAEAVPLLAAVAEQCADAGVLHVLGEALRAVGLVDEAVVRWRSAIGLQPDLPEPWLALGNVLLERDELAEAEHCFRSAIAARPDFVEALNNLGNALVAQHRLEEGRQSYTTALTLRPNNAGTGFAYALALLLGGDFAEGWEHFEARRNVGPLRWNYQRRPELPQWQPGVALDGKRVLLMTEQGAGDVIQFVRYAPLLAAHGAHVVLELPRELHGVFARMPGVARIVGLEDAVQDCDIACPLLSLPLYFGTTLDSIPAAVPYAEVLPDRMKQWRAWLGPARGRRVGLVCSGRTEHPMDRNRSVPLALLAPILAVRGCEFVLVQQQVRERDLPALAATPHVRWAGPEIHDFSDTAALLGELDLLVTVDTSVAHLAGALARPVWLMLPFAPDFRWLLGRGDSTWYPTMRLYRQPKRGDWESVIAAIQRDLHALR